IFLKSPIITQKPTLPFTEEEMDRILWATEVFPCKGIYGKGTALRIKAFILLLRYSGLRIGDAVCLEKSRIQDGKLFLYSQKTGVPVYVPLPDICLRALENVPNQSKTHFFWS